MERYEIATLTIRMGSQEAASLAAKAYSESIDARGTLLGCWLSDIGRLNQLIILRGFDRAEDLVKERARTLKSPDPFGCLDYMTDMNLLEMAPGLVSVVPTG
ncbi:MAG: hypothetical protein GYB21_21240 [Oceanospirillales bacterium]|nr:hypothetical protein [Oceanospirillales bacterium]